MDEFFFTYDLLKDGRIVRRGKGTVARRDADAIESYLERRYGERRWHRFVYQWHSTESAALKAEERKIDAFERRTGAKPPWNVHRGGGGGMRYLRCKSLLADGRSCRHLAIRGFYGFCGVHA